MIRKVIENSGRQVECKAAQPIDWEEILALVQAERLTDVQRTQLRSILDRNPALVRALPGISQQLRKRIIDSLVSQEGTGMLLLKQAEDQAKELGHDHSSVLEKLLIDVVITTWLQWQAAEWRYQHTVEQNALSLAQMEYWDRRLVVAQNRYLRACEALARVRRLMVRTPVQINIAAQQIVAS